MYGGRLTNQTVRHQDSGLKANRRGFKRATVLFARAGTRNTDRSRKSLSHSFSSCLSRESKFCETMRRRFKGRRLIIKTTTCTNDANKNKTNIQSDHEPLRVAKNSTFLDFLQQKLHRKTAKLRAVKRHTETTFMNIGGA